MIKKVTILEIAKELDLSRNTVAKALNNDETVAYDTRMMVVRKAWEMGYQKISASILEEYKLTDPGTENRTVIILAKRELSVFWNSIIVGISDELNRNNCRMRLNFVSAEDQNGPVLPRDFQDKADAVILMSIFEPAFTEAILAKGLPTVFLDCPIGRYEFPNNCDAVVCEGKSSVREITMHLASQGLTRIGFIGDISYCESFKQRYEGYCEAMNICGLEQDERYIFCSHLPGRFSQEEVDGIVSSMKELPQALVCANDDIALKCIRSLKQRGKTVPDDIAITGFDNEEKLTQADPVLTTVSVRNQMLGKRLVQQLIHRLENPDFPREIVSIATKPIYRKSSQVTNAQ